MKSKKFTNSRLNRPGPGHHKQKEGTAMGIRENWKLGVLALLVIGAAASGTAAVRSFAAADRAEPEPPQVEERFTDYGSAAYILKESGGYVAVFSSNDSRTVLVTDVPVSSLRQADQTLLRTGIAAADREAVLALLEDLGS